jgi:hypothetical protein
MLLVLLFAIVHHTDGAAPRGSTTATTFALHEASTAAVHEPRKLKMGKKNAKKGGGNTGGGFPPPVLPPKPVVECEGCCCSLKNGVTKCCGKTCANGLLCQT